MNNLFGLPKPPIEPNPMIIKHGRLSNQQCKTCLHLRRFDYHTKVYYKCEIRGITQGAGTDHRQKWCACGLWEEVGE